MSWSEICACQSYRGRWVALDGVRFNSGGSNPSEGTVIDADADLAELCARLRSANRRCCAILHCDDAVPVPASAPLWSRMFTH